MRKNFTKVLNCRTRLLPQIAMPLPEPLQAVIKKRRFWTDFFWITNADEGDYPGLDDCDVELPVTEEYQLSLNFSAWLSCFVLNFIDADGKSVEIAHDDQAHWHPHILRWKELDLICRAVADDDPELPHPGLPLLLLYRFAPICRDDDVDFITSMLDAAWRKLDIFSDAEIRKFIERSDARDAGFRWQYDDNEKFWWIEKDEGGTSGKGLYTHRHLEGARDQFPSANWEEMMAGAKELVGPPPNVGRAEQPTWKKYSLRSKHSLSLALPLRSPTRQLCIDSYNVIDAASRILKAVDLGSAQITGGLSTVEPDGRSVSVTDSVSLDMYADGLGRGLTILKKTLWWAMVPPEMLRLHDSRYNQVPFDLTEECKDEPHESYLQLGRIDPDESAWRPYRSNLNPACRDGFKVDQNVEVEGPDSEGWITISTSDAGKVGFKFDRFDEVSDDISGVVALRKISPIVSDVLYCFLLERKLILLPPAIIVSEEPKVAEGRKTHLVHSSFELHEILTPGPYNWWLNGETGEHMEEMGGES